MKNLFTWPLIAAMAAGSLHAQVEIDQAINLTGADGTRKVTNLEPPIDGTDAANKDYVDANVSGSGGGSAISKPEAMSSLSPSPMVYSAAMQYCENLTEDGHSDWRLPEAGEIQYFAGSSGATTDFLWTKTLTGSQDFATNQNFITVRLTDGKWRYGGAARFYFPSRSVSGTSTNNTTFTTVATFNPLTAGNLFVPTNITASVSINAGSCSNFGEGRLRYNFPDGSFYYSNTITVQCGSTNIVNVTSIPLLNEGASYASISVEVRVSGGSGPANGSITVGGYEITLSQKDGVELRARCVR